MLVELKLYWMIWGRRGTRLALVDLLELARAKVTLEQLLLELRRYSWVKDTEVLERGY